jgi:hypothetical protein
VGKALARVVQADRRKDKGGKADVLPVQERAALRAIRREARAAGSYLASGGKGGGSPSFVLGIFRRDEWRCKKCGELGSKEENGGLGLHHVGGIVSSPRVSRLGHKWVRANVIACCDRCHDLMHEEARAEGIDSSQVQPEGDKE